MCTIRYNNGVRRNSGAPSVAGGVQERVILRCNAVGTVVARLNKIKGEECSGNGCTYTALLYELAFAAMRSVWICCEFKQW